jgi:TonB-dependent starch-binding outer membrane protein SusC
MKIKLTKVHSVFRKRLLFIIMKTFLLLLCTTVFSFTTENAISQEKVTIDVDKVVPVDEVFTIIQKQTKYRFIYPQDMFVNMPNVQLKKGVIPVSKLLEQSLAGSNVNFKLSDDNTIVIKENRKTETLKSSIEQQFQINGTVVDDKNMPLPFANIKEKGTNNSTQSDANGKFNINVKNATATLVVSFIGFITKEVAVNNQSEIIIKLLEEPSTLQEVVVVGYGTQKKVTLTGAVSSIKTEEILQTKTANLANNLTGRVAGLTVSSRGGEPGADSVEILIRGIGTTGDKSPLYVIDGIANRGSFERLNPDDIESISVLKDASAAIYGAQAANGVILVTTKRGKKGETVFNFNQNYSLAQATRRPYLMNALQYYTWVDEINSRNSRPNQFQSIIRQYRDGTIDSTLYGNTDWWDVVIDDWTPQQQYAASASGGNDKTQFYLSGQLLNQDALYKGDAFGYKQYNVRSNLDTQLTNTLKIGFDVAARVGDKNSPTIETDALIRNIFSQRPSEFPYFENGLIKETIGGSPIGLTNGDSGSKATKTKKVDSKFSFNWDLPFITKGLYASGYAAIDFYTTTRKDLSKPYDRYNFNPTTGEYTNIKLERANNISLFEQYSEELNKTYHVKLGYIKSFDKHTINSFVAYEEYASDSKYIFASRGGLISETLPYFDFALDLNVQNGGKASQQARRNYFGKLNYSFDDKYLLDITMRYDGSANFPKDKRYGFFPAASIGWRISEEQFFNKNFISELKLRGSWGLLGNDKIPNFQYLDVYNLKPSYIFGEDPTRTLGLTPGRLPNPNITWETSEKMNVGLDLKLKRGLLDASIDAFYEKRSDILSPRNASVPVYTGIILPDENIGIVSNQGLEVQLNHRSKIFNSVSYTVGGQFSYSRSKIIFIDEAASVPAWQRRTGSPIDGLLVYNAKGIYQTQAEIDATKEIIDKDGIPKTVFVSPHFADAKPGDVIFEDVNGDYVINQDDKVQLDKSPTPNIVYGITAGLEWKGLSLNVLFQGQASAQTIYRPLSDKSLNIEDEYYRGRWTSPNFTPDALYPRAFDTQSSSYREVSTVWVKNNDFLRLKNVELSYSFPKAILKTLGIDSFRLFVAGNNLLIIYDNIKTNDPESKSQTGWYYPQQRLISSGISLTF